MLLEIADDALLVDDRSSVKYMVVQQLPDGHRYVVAGARIFSSQTEATRAWEAAATAFDVQTASGLSNAGYWRPQLLSFSLV